MPQLTLKPKLKPIRSFVKRESRLTTRQKNAIEGNDTLFLLDMRAGLLNMETLFPQTGPVVLEIGFGMGQSLLEMAQNSPQTNFIGIEVHRPGIGTLLASAEEKNIQNIRVLPEDAQEALPACIPDESLDGINIFFPDPWPKTRHHKRRLIQPAFMKLLEKKLKPGGFLHLATDWKDYAEHMLAVLSEADGFINTSPTGSFSDTRKDRPMTKYEKRGLSLGHEVWDIIFIKGEKGR